MKIDLLTIFPALLDGPFRESMIKRAQEQKLVTINLIDLRTYTDDRHHQVDDAPYGGGHGMILKPEPLFSAVEDLKNKTKSAKTKVILMTPQGRLFNQALARELSGLDHIILICGRYEGVDERVRIALVDEEISIGDYILTGGELAAAVVVDAITRLLPGFLAEEASANESFTEALLEHPHYTRPAIFRDMKVPPVLLSGNHGEIAVWRRKQSLKRTYERRSDLLNGVRLSKNDLDYLDSISTKE